MDSNDYDTNNLDPDVRLPPRKRLLAGLKRQSCSESTSQCSQVNSPSSNINPPVDQTLPTEFDVRLNNLLRSYKNGSKMSPKEIANAAKSAASNAAKAAEVARAIAEEKAAIAAEAVAAAKRALDLVALDGTGQRDMHNKKNKLKKQLPAEFLYNKYQPIENCVEDEELARKLHRAINSSARISKHSPGSGSDSKNHKHKRFKISSPTYKSSVSNGASVSFENAKLSLDCDGHMEGGMEFEGSNEEYNTAKVDEKVSKSIKDDDVEVESHLRKKKFEGSEVLCVNVRKRGRIKQKKLPLNVLSSMDQGNPKEEMSLTNPLITRARTDKSTVHQLSLALMEPSADNVSPLEVAPTWKCQDFNVSQVFKQDKLVQS